MVTAADLLDEPDPLASIPVEPPDDETPPDEATPKFLLQRNKFGPGAHGVYLPDGTPIGVWQRQMNFTPEELEKHLVGMGLPEDIIDFYVRTRRMGVEADQEIAAHPAIQKAAAQEASRLVEKQKLQQAFIKSMQDKKKK